MTKILLVQGANLTFLGRRTWSLTRTVRHHSLMRLRHRCAWRRLAAADLKRVTFAGPSLGNAFPPVATASLI
jgi:hypothetical protein